VARQRVIAPDVLCFPIAEVVGGNWLSQRFRRNNRKHRGACRSCSSQATGDEIATARSVAARIHRLISGIACEGSRRARQMFRSGHRQIHSARFIRQRHTPHENNDVG
jgi:hypothetical protein